jgi:hypothetical protein|mmetsp:Transcript_24381/g.26654  ORF Transcript_24381/g.26654 Transcript_24381/m.26654 type:complete len:152 (+) Transcript_24381:132-587(+)|eukprot:CAMPEP_0173144372 /NCGR_PEP_ID=MMETSP1105-20130129/7189_1 /TAXON_ID=2985 /ORGANISM="Ochromonas sp., Strain BG-1" /LENGTH=151 /DNA_ID=CAMNT_0014058031 /DNA_START=129 /DNA_END=584 /DNA_ORIENTATION=+
MKLAEQEVHIKGETKNPFPHQEFDITNYCGRMMCFIGAPYSTILNLEPEFVVIEEKRICGTNRRRIPYGEMNVDKTNFLCISCINELWPGCFCNQSLVEDIAVELQKRVGARGITGQLQKQEELLERFSRLEKRIDQIEKKIDIVVERMSR